MTPASALTAPRAAICGLSLDRPADHGGPERHARQLLRRRPACAAVDAALAQARALIDAGADILDIGGESTRPGSDPVDAGEEAGRILPVIEALRAAGVTTPISVDTRKAEVARAAFAAGADLFNDVSALTYDPGSLGVAAVCGKPVALMHAQGDPKTMQDAPAYDDVLLDVADFLDARVAAAEAAGIPRSRLMVDPGHRLRQDPRPQPRADPRPRDPARDRLRDPVRRLAQALHRRDRRRARAARPDGGLGRRRARGFAAGRADDTGA